MNDRPAVSEHATGPADEHLEETPDAALGQPGDDGKPLLVGVPDGGGLRQAFMGLSVLRVPSLRSVVVTACSLSTLLVVMTVFVTGLDVALGLVLSGRRLAASAVFGVLGLAAASGSLALLLTTALDGPTQPRVHLERHPLRLASGLLLLLFAAVCALLWVHGVTTA